MQVSRPVVAAAVSGVLLATMLVLKMSGAAFTSTTANPSNSFEAARVQLADNDSGTTALATTALFPGQSTQTCVRVDYSGTISATVKLHGTVSGGLAPYLNLVIERGGGASAYGDCTGFASSATVYSGTVSAFAATHTGYGNGAGAYTANPDSSEWFRIAWTLQDANAAQGLTASGTYTWEAHSGGTSTNFRSTTGTSTVTVPAASLSPASSLVATRGCTALPSARWIDLSWTASPSSGVTQYRVYRSDNGGAFASVHTTAGTSWQNTGLTNSTTYAYYVVAERAGTTWVAAASNTASQTTHGICV